MELYLYITKHIYFIDLDIIIRWVNRWLGDLIFSPFCYIIYESNIKNTRIRHHLCKIIFYSQSVKIVCLWSYSVDWGRRAVHDLLPSRTHEVTVLQLQDPECRRGDWTISGHQVLLSTNALVSLSYRLKCLKTQIVYGDWSKKKIVNVGTNLWLKFVKHRTKLIDLKR